MLNLVPLYCVPRIIGESAHKDKVQKLVETFGGTFYFQEHNFK